MNDERALSCARAAQFTVIFDETLFLDHQWIAREATGSRFTGSSSEPRCCKSCVAAGDVCVQSLGRSLAALVL